MKVFKTTVFNKDEKNVGEYVGFASNTREAEKIAIKKLDKVNLGWTEIRTDNHDGVFVRGCQGGASHKVWHVREGEVISQ